MKFTKERKMPAKKNERSQFKKKYSKPYSEQLGINLSLLSQDQKKMCVKLLAQGNVEFIKKDNTYVATLRVPTQQLEQFNCQQIKIPFSQQDENTCENKQQKKNKGKDTIKREQIVNDGKKPLSKVVKIPNIEKLQQIYPFVDIYIYPKRINFNSLIEIIQNTYQSYWAYCQNQQENLDSHNTSNSHHNLNILQNQQMPSLQKIFFEVLENSNQIFNRGTKSSKIDQHLVNILDTVYHFQFKSLGVKIFANFLTGESSTEILNYFLILRALMQSIMEQSILDYSNSYKQKDYNPKTNKDFQKTSHLSIFFKLKWNPYDFSAEESQVKEFLRISLMNEHEYQPSFQKLTKLMYFDQLRRNNFINYFELIDFMLSQFNQQNQQKGSQNTNFELSYSRDSTLQQILFSETQRQQSKPEEVYIQEKIQFVSPIFEQEKNNESNFLEEFSEAYCQKSYELANKMSISAKNYTQKIEQKIRKCLDATTSLNKLLWVEATNINGTESELLYIQNLQRDFQKLKYEANSKQKFQEFIKRILYGPGVMKMLIQATYL